MKKILFLDIETNPKSNKVVYGATFLGNELHEYNTKRLEEWIKQAKYICGHNILKHDIPELKKRLGEDIFNGKKFIDTLLWSPILFVNRPNHKLFKGYKVVNASEVNNPLSDSKLTEDLLAKELNRFNQIEEKLKAFYFKLLKNNLNFNTFFELAGYTDNNLSNELNVKDLIANDYCSDNSLDFYINEYPVEFSYVFTLFKLGDNDAILPAWVRHEYPKADEILETIRFKSCENPNCSYCSIKLNPKKALKKYFDYTDFRKFEKHREISLQEQAVLAGLQRKSFVAVFPTGGGKSLTFQLPALMRGEATRHLTVVISPLVSLMKDQVDNLIDRFGITSAVAINGLLSPLERNEAFEMVQDGTANLLYLSPESLRSPSIYNLLLSRSIARFVIDEAHCFSSWGQDFRVDYLFIGEFINKIEEKKKLKSIPVSCFTATAKPQVIKDIKAYFRDRLNLELEEFITSKGRTNLSYEVINVEDPERKMAYLMPVLEECEKPVIVYASRTKQVEEVSKLINEVGFNSTYFHGQLKKEEKKANMEAFMSEEKDIIVATSAFGMGVDKDNVKTVIHFNISDSLENYVQESGRAGRDEKIKAKCYILFNENDLNKHFSLLQQTKLNLKEIKDIWKSIKQQAKYRDKISKSALEIARKSGWDSEMRDIETKVKTALSAMEDNGYLKRTLNSPRVFADSLLVKSFSRGQEMLKNSKNITDRDKIDCAKILKRIVTDKETRIDYLSDVTEINPFRVQEVIQILRDVSILGDTKDLSAFVNLLQSKRGSKKVLEYFLKTEKALLGILPKQKIDIPLRQLNQTLLDKGVLESNVEIIRSLLTYWDKRRFVKKNRVDKERDIYSINILDVEKLKEDISWRHDLSLSCFSFLENLAEKNQEFKGRKDEVPVTFSLIEIKNANQFMGELVEKNTKRYEISLLFLNDIKAIALEGGFMVTYNKLNLSDIDKSRPTFLKADYQKMEQFYENKTEQIHIVGEYAKRCIKNYESALIYVNDYFTIEYEDFISKYFPKKEERQQIKRALTPKRFEEIIHELDPNQLEVIKDNKSDNTLVYAGPGSGKTKVLVHKIASLLLIEDIKPEQFLMLTFSKAAALEFKQRVRKLVPEYVGLIKITTFHGFCFQLLGQLGDLDKSQNVIQDCIEAIKKDEIDITSIENKSVLLFDEFQDINKDEWQLIELIIEKAGKPRVIAVGDDDQNIYSFRGSSNEFMTNYRVKYSPTLYTLPKNYRSYPEIVEFNNQVLNFLNNRLKNQLLIPHQKHKMGSINLIKYKGEYLSIPLVNYLHSLSLSGTKSVLTRTNIEALEINSMLNELGYKTRLMAGFEGFSLSSLYEIRVFTNFLKSEVGEVGIIFETNWEKAVEKFKSQFKDTPHYYTCNSLISKFDFSFPEKKLLIDWYEYCREINMEDAVKGDSDVIVVSTMHKSKGKEYDHVFILANGYDYSSSESRRLLYVATTRAKKSVHIHTNISFYDKIESTNFNKEYYEGELKEPLHYELILSHKDIFLSFQNNDIPKAIIKDIKTGERLEVGEFVTQYGGRISLKKTNDNSLVLFSNSFTNNQLNSFKNKGYNIVSANVEYIVYWYNKDTNSEYKLVLPKLRFEKIKIQNIN